MSSPHDNHITKKTVVTRLILEECPSLQYKLLFGLARLAGLRTPSEASLLTFTDINWHKATMTVRSPKTERHEGHAQREVPIVPELFELIQQRFDQAEPSEERVLTLDVANYARRRLARIIVDAGVEPWSQLYQTLRRSCEIEWALTVPQFIVSKWIGHSITVSGKHYTNQIPEASFKLVTQKAAHNPAQQASESTENDQKQSKSQGPSIGDNFLQMQVDSSHCQRNEKYPQGDLNPCYQDENLVSWT